MANQMQTPTRRTEGQNGSAERCGREGRPVFRAPVDILENDQEIVVLLDAPGASADGIDIRYEDGSLTVFAPVEARELPGAPGVPGAPEGSALVREYGVGDFRRTFRVGQDIDVQNIQASYEDGVLRLALPRTEAARPRKIAVSAG